MLAALVGCVAAAAGRPSSDADACLQKLNSHWLSSIDDYAALGQQQRRELQLPLFLRVQLDRIVAVTTAASADARSVALLNSSRSIAQSPTATSGAVRAWLTNRVKAPNSAEIFSLFSNSRLDDFFLLPMLDDTALRILGVSDKSILESITREIASLRQLQPHQMVGEWARVQGCDREATLLEQELVDAWVLRASKGAELAETLSLPPLHPLIEAVPPLTHFSSVLESFVWLHSMGFGKYSFHFARYNIPFYALPYVNFFILEEMGVSHDDNELLTELQRLKSDTLFGAKALAYWLRDLELERYIGGFAAAAILSLDHLMQLATSGLPRPGNQAAPPMLTELVAPLSRVITIPNDRNKLLAGMQELNEFHWYYRATGLLLQRIGFGRFAQLFTQSGISIDVISLLEEAHLAHMGIKSLSDRNALLNAIARVRQHLPHGLDNIVPVPEPSSVVPGAVPTDTRPLDELLSYINISSLDDSPRGKKKQKPKVPTKGVKGKTAPAKAKKEKEKNGGSNSTPSSPLIPAKSPVVEEAASSPPTRVAGGSGKRSSSAVLPTAPTPPPSPKEGVSPSASTDAAAKSLLASKSALWHSDSSGIGLTPEKMAAQLRASGGASPEIYDHDIDPERQAQVDDEVEQFRRRLEAAQAVSGRSRTRIFAL